MTPRDTAGYTAEEMKEILGRLDYNRLKDCSAIDKIPGESRTLDLIMSILNMVLSFMLYLCHSSLARSSPIHCSPLSTIHRGIAGLRRGSVRAGGGSLFPFYWNVGLNRPGHEKYAFGSEHQ